MFHAILNSPPLEIRQDNFYSVRHFDEAIGKASWWCAYKQLTGGDNECLESGLELDLSKDGPCCSRRAVNAGASRGRWLWAISSSHSRFWYCRYSCPAKFLLGSQCSPTIRSPSRPIDELAQTLADRRRGEPSYLHCQLTKEASGQPLSVAKIIGVRILELPTPISVFRSETINWNAVSGILQRFLEERSSLLCFRA